MYLSWYLSCGPESSRGKQCRFRLSQERQLPESWMVPKWSAGSDHIFQLRLTRCGPVHNECQPKVSLLLFQSGQGLSILIGCLPSGLRERPDVCFSSHSLDTENSEEDTTGYRGKDDCDCPGMVTSAVVFPSPAIVWWSLWASSSVSKYAASAGGQDISSGPSCFTLERRWLDFDSACSWEVPCLCMTC